MIQFFFNFILCLSSFALSLSSCFAFQRDAINILNWQMVLGGEWKGSKTCVCWKNNTQKTAQRNKLEYLVWYANTKFMSENQQIVFNSFTFISCTSCNSYTSCNSIYNSINYGFLVTSNFAKMCCFSFEFLNRRNYLWILLKQSSVLSLLFNTLN